MGQSVRVYLLDQQEADLPWSVDFRGYLKGSKLVWNGTVPFAVLKFVWGTTKMALGQLLSQDEAKPHHHGVLGADGPECTLRAVC